MASRTTSAGYNTRALPLWRGSNLTGGIIVEPDANNKSWCKPWEGTDKSIKPRRPSFDKRNRLCYSSGRCPNRTAFLQFVRVLENSSRGGGGNGPVKPRQPLWRLDIASERFVSDTRISNRPFPTSDHGANSVRVGRYGFVSLFWKMRRRLLLYLVLPSRENFFVLAA